MQIPDREVTHLDDAECRSYVWIQGALYFVLPMEYKVSVLGMGSGDICWFDPNCDIVIEARKLKICYA